MNFSRHLAPALALLFSLAGALALSCSKSETKQTKSTGDEARQEAANVSTSPATAAAKNQTEPTEVPAGLLSDKEAAVAVSAEAPSEPEPGLVQEPGTPVSELPATLAPDSKSVKKQRVAAKEPKLKTAPKSKLPPAPAKLTWLRDEKVARARARKQNKRILVDFGATWCLPCEEYEKITFRDAAVKETLAKMVLLKFDVSENSDADKAVQKRFGVSALPALLVLSAKGKEISRVTKFLKPDAFLNALPK